MATRPTVDAGQWRTSLADRFFGLRAETQDHEAAALAGNLVSIDLGEISAHRVWGNRQTLHRTRRAVRTEPSDLLKICLVVQGHATLEQGGHSVDLDPGTFALYDTGRPYRIINHDDWQVQVLTAARTDLSLTPQRLKSLQLTALPAAEGPGLLLASYLEGLTKLGGATSLASAHLREASIALLNSALTQSPDGVVADNSDVVADQILRYIEAHLPDPLLSVEAVGRAHHMSVRSLQRVLAGQGLTFSSTVRERRLASIRQGLANPALAHLPIAAVAARWGVVDQPWLSRAFKSTYGVSPSAFRREVMGR